MSQASALVLSVAERVAPKGIAPDMICDSIEACCAWHAASVLRSGCEPLLWQLMQLALMKAWPKLAYVSVLVVHAAALVVEPEVVLPVVPELVVPAVVLPEVVAPDVVEPEVVLPDVVAPVVLLSVVPVGPALKPISPHAVRPKNPIKMEVTRVLCMPKFNRP